MIKASFINLIIAISTSSLFANWMDNGTAGFVMFGIITLLTETDK